MTISCLSSILIRNNLTFLNTFDKILVNMRILILFAFLAVIFASQTDAKGKEVVEKYR